MKYSKAQTRARIHKLPALRFEEQKLTSFAGLVLFQALFVRLDLKERVKRCFAHVRSSSSYGIHRLVLLIVVQLIMGFRRLSDVQYYRDDPMVERLLGLRSLPDVSTISRALTQADDQCVTNLRDLSRALVLDRVQREQFARLTLDFDGSVQTTKRHAQGVAVGYNKVRKGARSYYVLLSTLAQTGQFFDMHHRSGNVHDSNGAVPFIDHCLTAARQAAPGALLESRLDSAFFSKDILPVFEAHGAEFTVAVPFERLPELKGLIEARKRWTPIDDEWSWFETDWRPQSWNTRYRFLFVRKRVQRQVKGPLQLDLFVPRDHDFEYKVIVTNKHQSAKAVVEFHNGRGSQEALFGDAKQDAAWGLIPTRRLHGNQIYTLCAMMAHNLSRELQMIAAAPRKRATAKRAAAWTFQTLATLRHRLIQRAGRFTRPQGELTLTLSANEAVRAELLHFLDRIQNAA